MNESISPSRVIGLRRRRLRTVCGAAVAGVLLCACSSSTADEPQAAPPAPEPKPSVALRIRPGAADTSFAEGSRMGLYLAVRRQDVTAVSLLPQGNRMDNRSYFLDGGFWMPTLSSLYWPDDTTRADLYLYSPYVPVVDNALALPVSLPADQSKAGACRTALLYTGRALGVAPTQEEVPITVSQVMSRLEVTLVPGAGFTDKMLSEMPMQVIFGGLKMEGGANLATGAVTPSGLAADITPLRDGCRYRAFIVPQTVAGERLVTVKTDEQDFIFSKPMTFEPGGCYRLTVTLAKTSSGIQVSIAQWQDDGTDYGGAAE